VVGGREIGGGVTTQLLKPGMPFLELNMRNWAPGLYLGSLSLDGFRVGEVKFNIVR